MLSSIFELSVRSSFLTEFERPKRCFAARSTFLFAGRKPKKITTQRLYIGTAYTLDYAPFSQKSHTLRVSLYGPTLKESGGVGSISLPVMMKLLVFSSFAAQLFGRSRSAFR